MSTHQIDGKLTELDKAMKKLRGVDDEPVQPGCRVRQGAHRRRPCGRDRDHHRGGRETAVHHRGEKSPRPAPLTP